MLNICEIYHIYATYMTDEIVSHICTLFGTYIVHTCETIQLSYMPHICDIFHIYLTYMKCSIFYIFNLYVIYGTYMPKCMSYMEHICAAYMRCIYVVYMLAYMQTYMTTYMLHICMFRMGGYRLTCQHAYQCATLVREVYQLRQSSPLLPLERSLHECSPRSQLLDHTGSTVFGWREADVINR